MRGGSRKDRRRRSEKHQIFSLCLCPLFFRVCVEIPVSQNSDWKISAHNKQRGFRCAREPGCRKLEGETERHELCREEGKVYPIDGRKG